MTETPDNSESAENAASQATHATPAGIDDPTSTAPHGDWTQVGAAFTALGDQIQAHFSQLLNSATAPAAPAESSTTQPFEDLGKQFDEALTSFRNAVSDPRIADAAKSAADQLMDALKIEVDSVATQVSEVGNSAASATPELGAAPDSPATPDAADQSSTTTE